MQPRFIMSHDATGESIPPDRRESTPPLEPTGIPPGPFTFSTETRAASEIISMYMVRSGVSRSTEHPMPTSALPISLLTSCEVIGNRLSERLVSTLMERPEYPEATERTASSILFRSCGTICTSETLSMPNVLARASRAPAASNPPLGSAITLPPRSRSSNSPNGARAILMFFMSFCSKRGRFLPFREISEQAALRAWGNIGIMEKNEWKGIYWQTCWLTFWYVVTFWQSGWTRVSSWQSFTVGALTMKTSHVAELGGEPREYTAGSRMCTNRWALSTEISVPG